MLKAIATAVLCAALLSAATAGAAPKSAKTKKETEPNKSPTYAALFKQYQLPPESVGFLVVDAATGKPLAARQADELFIPASSIKAPTAIAALNILGPDYRFETAVYTRGSVKDGVLYGDVILRGGGDPALTTDEYASLVAALKARVIKSVKGRFLYDATLFPTQEAIDLGDDIVLSYNPSVGPLSLNFNRVKIRWWRGKNGLTTQAISKTDKIEIPVDFVKTGVAPANQVGRYGIAYKNGGDKIEWLLSSGARRRGEIWVPVKRPAVHAAEVFQKIAKRAGIDLPPPIAGKLPPDAVFVARNRSEPLVVIARKFLKFSTNVSAELTGIVAARKLGGKPIALTPSAMALVGWFKERLPKLDWAGVVNENHSGLSTISRIAPRHMVAIMRHAQNQSFAGHRMEDLLRPYWIGQTRGRVPSSMSVSGIFEKKRRGKKRAVGLPPWITVRAKTGTLSYSRALAGYMTTLKKRKLVFAIFVSDYRVREIQQKTGNKYKSLSRGRWAWRSRALMRTIVQKWAVDF